ncbi:hypothetical protein BDN67DRAFT_974132 [Paxillus ammoniavirescens]|nr:hypothetical protein BDN67DRAFT_974132 [Paxillus ammoniavirescens]
MPDKANSTCLMDIKAVDPATVSWSAHRTCFQMVGSKSTVVAKYEALAVYTVRMTSAIHICELFRGYYSRRTPH